VTTRSRSEELRFQQGKLAVAEEKEGDTGEEEGDSKDHDPEAPEAQYRYVLELKSTIFLQHSMFGVPGDANSYVKVFMFVS